MERTGGVEGGGEGWRGPVEGKSLYLVGAGGNSYLNFDTFHFHIFTFSHVSHIRNCFTAK